MSKLALTPSEVAVYSALAGPSKPQPSLYPRLEGINFEWCRNAGSAELAISPLWSGLIAVKTARPPAALPCDLFPSAPSEGANVSRSNSESVSLEGRRYFDANQFGGRSFVSARIGTSKNIGMALGMKITHPSRAVGMSLHIGAYANAKVLTDIHPTVGFSFNWNY